MAQCEDGFLFSALVEDFAALAIGGRKKPPSSLAIFDFDSTLFRSPLPNADLWAPELRGCIISDCEWFLEPRTLGPPLLPERPSLDWWDVRVLRELLARRFNEGSAVADLVLRHDPAAPVNPAETYVYDSDTLVVLLTGRRRDIFFDRISSVCASLADLLHAPPLFDLIFLKEYENESGFKYQTTMDFKMAVISRLLSTLSSITSVEIWDDRKKHLESFGEYFQSLQDEGRLSSYETHYVVQDVTLTQHIPEEMEYEMVMDLIGKCNARIIAAAEREKAARASAIAEYLSPVIEVASPLISATSVVFPHIPIPQTTSPSSEVPPGIAAQVTSPISDSSPSSRDSTPVLIEQQQQQQQKQLPPMLFLSSQTPINAATQHLMFNTKDKRKHQKSSLSQRPRKSISNFRSIIDITQFVQYTGIFLSPESTRLLLATIPPPLSPSYYRKADHITICLGKSAAEFLEPLGGLGATVWIKAVAVGFFQGVTAVKVEWDERVEDLERNAESMMGPEQASLPKHSRISKNETPHCTVYVPLGMKAKDSNLITEWSPLEPELSLVGVIGEKKLTTLKANPVAQQKAKDVSLGALVKKYHPQLQGKEVGAVIARVHEWMEKTHMDNSSNNAPEIELFISSLSLNP